MEKTPGYYSRKYGIVGLSLVLKPSLRETTSGLPCCCCCSEALVVDFRIKTVFTEFSVLPESSVLPDMVSGVELTQ